MSYCLTLKICHVRANCIISDVVISLEAPKQNVKLLFAYALPQGSNMSFSIVLDCLRNVCQLQKCLLSGKTAYQLAET